MEVRLDASEGQAVPQDTFVALRIGEVQKQSRFANSRTYRFPEPSEGRGNIGRIEIFKRIGHVTVALNGAGEFQDVEVPCDFPGLKNLAMKLAVHSAAKAAAVPSPEKKGRAKERVDAAQKYLQEHKVEEILAEVMREVITARPEDPHAFISGRITEIAVAKGISKADLAKPLPEVTQPLKEAEKTCKPTGPSVEELQARASGRLQEACKTGELRGLLSSMRKGGEAGRAAEELRAKAADKLQEACQSGELLKLLSSMRQETKVASAEELRSAVADKLKEACASGKLQSVTAEMAKDKAAAEPAKEATLAPTQPKDSKEELRLRARECLLAASPDSLKSAFETITEAKKGERLCESARDCLLSAEEGSLKSAFLTASAKNTLLSADAKDLEAAKVNSEAKSLLLSADEDTLKGAKVLNEAKKCLQTASEESLKEAKARSASPTERTLKPESFSKAESCLYDTQPFHLLPSTGTWFCRLRGARAPAAKAEPAKAPAVAPAPEAASTPSFSFKASVGTWLVRRPMNAQIWKLPEETATAEAAEPLGEEPQAPPPSTFTRRPSVGTWCTPKRRPSAAAAEAALEKAAAPAAPAKESPAAEPFRHRPSVGTWLARNPLPLKKQKKEEEEEEDEALRLSVGAMLMGAVNDGSLSKALSRAIAEKDEALRLDVSDMLVSAALNGDLMKAVAQVMQKKDSARDAEAPAPAAFTQRPSVGTWLVTRRASVVKQQEAAAAAPATAPAFEQRASVGTWLQKPGPRRRSSVQTSPAAATAAAPAPAAAALAKPFRFCASVGTWLQPLPVGVAAAAPVPAAVPPPLPERPAEQASPALPEKAAAPEAPPALPEKAAAPEVKAAAPAAEAKAAPPKKEPEDEPKDILQRTYSDLVTMDREELIDNFQSTLQKKDQEIAELRRMVAEMQK